MRLRIALLGLILALTGSPAWGADFVTTNIFCQHRETIENYVELMEAEGGRISATAILSKDLIIGECIRFPVAARVPVLERGTPREAVFVEKSEDGETKTHILLTPVRVKNLWGIEFMPIEST